jgi:hypothetical protein
MQDVEDVVMEGDAVAELLTAAGTTAKAQQEAAAAPRGYDPAAVFLLSLAHENLFEATQEDEWFRCKGCRELVNRRKRADHHASHKRTYKQHLAAPQRSNGNGAVRVPPASAHGQTPLAPEAQAAKDAMRQHAAAYDNYQAAKKAGDTEAMARHEPGYEAWKQARRDFTKASKAGA